MDERFEELISAFFDGEATAEQRQQVEKLLAENSDGAHCWTSWALCGRT